jgi:hypothetical protein
MGYVFAMEHSFNHLNQSLVEPFYNTIGFWAIWWNVLLLNAFHFAVILENFRNELTIVVIPNGLDLAFELISTMAWNSLKIVEASNFCFRK